MADSFDPPRGGRSIPAYLPLGRVRRGAQSLLAKLWEDCASQGYHARRPNAESGPCGAGLLQFTA
jgi:hypothetical protein